MIDSNTYLEATRGPRRRLWRAVWLAAATPVPAAPSVRGGALSAHSIRDAWGSAQGLKAGTIYAIAQSADGYLWIGAEKGLFRFDGLRFRQFNRAVSSMIPEGPVLGLVQDAEGNLWVRFQGVGLLRYRDGAFQSVAPALGGDTGITAMCRGAKGELMLAFEGGPLRYVDGKFEPVKTTGDWRLVISMAEASNAEVWMGTRDAGLFSSRRGLVPASGVQLANSKINAVLPINASEMWIGTDGGVVRWDGSGLTQSGIPDSLRRVQTLTLIKDHKGNIWAGCAAGIVRVDAHGGARLEDPARSGEVTALLEDREGNLWAGAGESIERFRDRVFTNYSAARGPLFVDTKGRAWVGALDGGLISIQGEEVTRIATPGLPKDVIYSIDGAPGAVWIGTQRSGLACLRIEDEPINVKIYRQADGLAQDSVFAVHCARDGSVWAGTVNSGVSRLSGGKFITYTTANGLASNTVSDIEESADGTIWFATPNGLSAFSNGVWKSLAGAEGLPPGSVNCLFTDSDGVLWIGSSKGLGFLRSGRVQFSGQIPEPLLEEIFGIAEDKTGWLWVITPNRVVRVKRDKFVNGALADGDLREYGAADGLPGAEGAKRFRSVATDSFDRVWLSLSSGVSMVDAARLNQASAPVLVHVESMSADNEPLDLRNPMRIPASKRRIRISYAGLSLTAPERIRFRYMLEGFDHGWSEPTAEREAAYTNLPPRDYRFRLVATNPDGTWNPTEAAAQFEVLPAFWQTLWFRLSIVLASIACVVALYRLRMHQMTKRLSMRFEERLAERTRIAQELHDTLLQGFLSASMQLNVAVDQLPPDTASKPALTRVIQLMSEVIEEARNAVRGLRSPISGSLDLERAFSDIRREMNYPDAGFRVIVEGRAQALHPVLRDEIFRIGREAIVNAFRHSQAKSIEVELEYTTDELRILVRDDGRGIDAETLESGREGHWGLIVMRERAERIGAQLRLWSKVSAGTEIELSVPGRIAFGKEDSPDTAKWPAWRRLGRKWSNWTVHRDGRESGK